MENDRSMELTDVSIANEQQQSLAPTDTGKGAWLALAACSAVQLPVWGFSLASGVLQSYYLAHEDEFDGDISNVAIIGTTVTGTLYLSSPILFTLLARYPKLRPVCGPVGLVILILSLIASSFTSSVEALVATQGVLQAIGGGLLFAPTTLYLDEWFVRRKGLAIGIMWSAKSLAGVALPLIMEPALEKFGWKTVLRSWAVFLFLITAPLLYHLRPRIPVPPSSLPRRLNLSFLTLKPFWILSSANLLQSLGYFLPTAYLPSYALSLSLSPHTSTLLLALLNGVSVPGSAILGAAIDRCGLGPVVLVSSAGSTVAVFALWGLAGGSLPGLVAFAVAYGFFAGGSSSTWSGMLAELERLSPGLETGLVFGLLAGGRGIGNVVSGPLSVLLMQHAGNNRADHPGGYGTEYGYIIIFTGISAFLGSLGWSWKLFK